MIFHIPHASPFIPLAVRRKIALPDDHLSEEILKMTDWFTDELFADYARAGDAVMVHRVSRLVVDPERFVHDAQECMAAVGMGVIYTRTAGGCELRPAPAPDEREHLLDTYYRPHHGKFEQAVRADLEKRGQSLILDCHSFPSKPLPYEPNQDPARPDICIGTDQYHTPERLARAVEDLCRREGVGCIRNRPFAGAIVPLAYYSKDARVRSIMIEINRRLYMNEGDGTKSTGYGDCRSLVGRVIEAVRALEIPELYSDVLTPRVRTRIAPANGEAVVYLQASAS